MTFKKVESLSFKRWEKEAGNIRDLYIKPTIYNSVICELECLICTKCEAVILQLLLLAVYTERYK